MTDESVATYGPMLDQLMDGQQWLQQTLSETFATYKLPLYCVETCVSHTHVAAISANLKLTQSVHVLMPMPCLPDYQPNVSWSIDPFGLSPTMPHLLKRSGVERLLVLRAHYSIKRHLAFSQQLEFNWQQTWGSSTCTCTCTCISTSIRMSTCISTLSYMYMCIYNTSTCTLYLYVHVGVRLHVHVPYMCMIICVHVYMYPTSHL